ncbi:MAG TPA: hypothetical protein DEH78_13440 [Solibacterales bacterium]|nr:hypothetical protein [Bryobacterales bacterium]
MATNAKRPAKPTKKQRKPRPHTSKASDVGTETGEECCQDILPLVRTLLTQAINKVNENDTKATLADLIRLIHLRLELEGEQAKEVTVRWVENEEKPRPTSPEP